MNEIVEKVKAYREEHHRLQTEFEHRKRELTREAHEFLAHAEPQEFVEALNTLYWDMPEIQVAPVNCSTGLRMGDFRAFIEPRPSGVRCALDGCDMEVFATSRSTMNLLNRPSRKRDVVLCPKHYSRWWQGLHREQFPVYAPYQASHINNPRSYPNHLWMHRSVMAARLEPEKEEGEA